MRRGEIAQAVLDVVAERGPEGLSVAAVAERIGLVPSGIYRHYRNKDALIDAVLEMIESRLLANVDLALEETDDAVEALRRILERHVRLIRGNSALPRIIFSEQVFGGSSERRARLFRVLGGYLRRVAGVVRRGQEQGRIRRDLDPQTVALLLVGVFQPAVILWHLSGGRFDVAGHVERGWEAVRAAIELPPGRPGSERVVTRKRSSR